MKKQNNWFLFAEEDMKMADNAFREDIFNQVCFHSQQGVEKMLKGYLYSKGVHIPKTHFLVELLKLCMKLDKNFQDYQEGCSILDAYYIPTRYPDAIPGSLPEGLPQKNNAKEALSILKRMAGFIKKL